MHEYFNFVIPRGSFKIRSVVELLMPRPTSCLARSSREALMLASSASLSAFTFASLASCSAFSFSILFLSAMSERSFSLNLGSVFAR
jgi:hypothetical protein